LPPKILKFDGPNAVSCRKGETRVVSYEYSTRNAVRVEASIDSRPVGAPPSFPPAHGTIGFGYACPGPHTLRITAFGAGDLSVHSAVGFDKTNRLTSATSSEIAVASQ